MWCIVLQAKGNSKNAVIPADRCGESPNADLASAILRRANKPVPIGTWKWSGHVLHLFGYKTGKSGTENKHELPPPFDSAELFGDAVIMAVKTGENKLANFGVAEYTKFYKDGHNGIEENESEHGDDSDSESEGSESEPEEEPEAESEPEDESDSEPEPDAESDEESVVHAPVPKLVKTKRNNKKMPTWYTIPQLTPEPYTLSKSPLAV